MVRYKENNTYSEQGNYEKIHSMKQQWLYLQNKGLTSTFIFFQPGHCSKINTIMIWKRQNPSAYDEVVGLHVTFFGAPVWGLIDPQSVRQIQVDHENCSLFSESVTESKTQTLRVQFFIKATKGDFWLALNKFWQVSESSGKDSGQSVPKKTKAGVSQNGTASNLPVSLHSGLLSLT